MATDLTVEAVDSVKKEQPVAGAAVAVAVLALGLSATALWVAARNHPGAPP